MEEMCQKTLMLLLVAARDSYVSGEAISERLGVTRAMVWKYIKALQESGLQIEGVTRKGYRLCVVPDSLELPYLRAAFLRRGYEGPWSQALHSFAEVDSTNRVARALAAQGAPEGTVVVAETQTAGRGRLGRNWSSAAGKGLWVSLVLRPEMRPEQMPALTLLCGLAMNRALGELGLPTRIKWPNDLVIQVPGEHGPRKLCGILTEMVADIDQVYSLVVGVGVNVSQELDDFPPELRDTAGSLAMLGYNGDRATLLAAFLQRFSLLYGIAKQEGVAAILPAYRLASATLGHEVELRQAAGQPGEKVWRGKALDVDTQGALLIRVNGGEELRFVSGDVSLRPLD